MLERRRERRLPVRLPILVRGADQSGERFEEHTSSEDISRSGMAFSTGRNVGNGTQLDIIIASPTTAGEDAEFSTQGRIVHIESIKQGKQLLVGVEFVGPRFNRMFVSEST